MSLQTAALSVMLFSLDTQRLGLTDLKKKKKLKITLRPYVILYVCALLGTCVPQMCGLGLFNSAGGLMLGNRMLS